jgi:outer membrane protein OmpA-like peptidoglycan-associated protein
MKTKTCLLILALLVSIGFMSAAYTSPGWTYGYGLGVTRGDNAGSAENFGPLVQGNVQLELFGFLNVRIGMGYTQLHASKTYSTSTIMADYRAVLQPFRKYKFAPYLYAGNGASKELKDSKADIIPLIPFGVGMQTRIKKGMLLDVTAGYNLSNSDALDSRVRAENDKNSITGNKQDGFFSLTFGLSFYNAGPEPAPQPVVPAPYIPPTPPPAPKPTPPPPPAPKPVEVVPVPVIDPNTIDTDGDGLMDVDEINKYKTDPRNPDTDGEGLNDYAEVIKYKTNPLNPDTDGDGLNDYVEVMQYKTDPLNPDTDGDTLKDGEEVQKYRTDPLVADTDKGSVDDGTEVKAGTNPLDPKDDVLDLTEGASFSLEGILFETGKATLLPVSIPILEQAYTALAANPDVKIIIIGHTDNVGAETSNQTLSMRRADAVKNWLVAKGMNANRIKTLGKGELEPRATNDTAAGRTLNRRIEFQVEK